MKRKLEQEDKAAIEAHCMEIQKILGKYKICYSSSMANDPIDRIRIFAHKILTLVRIL